MQPRALARSRLDVKVTFITDYAMKVAFTSCQPR
jgi:hypothetical protein